MIRSILIVLSLSVAVLAADNKPGGYFNDFEKTPPGKPPADMLILNGEFAVKEEAGNHFLEVAPDPLDAFGVLFGPEAVINADVSAKVQATSTGRRFPEFGIGCGDAGGYKLMLLPGQSSVEIRKGDETVAQAPYDKWQSGQWVSLRIQAIEDSGKWRIQGKVWSASANEPGAWNISYAATEAPPTGRASLWATPYSGTPIRFDDIAAAGAGGVEKKSG